MGSVEPPVVLTRYRDREVLGSLRYHRIEVSTLKTLNVRNSLTITSSYY
jgi:hypothetical protein